MAKNYHQLPPPHARIDWTHPITRGLLISIHANNIFSNTAASSGIGIINGRTRTDTFKGTKTQDFYEGDGTNALGDLGLWRTGESSTVVMQVALDGTGGGGYSRLFDIQMGNVATTGSGQLDMYRIGSTTSAIAIVAAGGGWENSYNIFGFYFPNSLQCLDMKYYKNGVSKALTSNTNGTGSPSNNNAVVRHYLGGNGGNARNIDGRIRFFYEWNRELTPSEHLLLANDPFCFYTWEGKPTPNYSDVRIGTKTSDFTTFANATRSSGAINLEWANMSNAQTSNDTRATVTSFDPAPAMPYSGNTHYIKASQLASTIPSSAIPLGIRIGIERRSTATGTAVIKDSQVYVVKGGTIQTSENKADTSTNYPTSDTVKYYGAANDGWSQTWAASDINDSGFGIVLSVNIAQDMEDAGLPQIDQIFSEITYIGDDTTAHSGDGSASVALTSSGGGLLTLLGAASPSIVFTSDGNGIGSFVGAGSSTIALSSSGTPFLTLQGAASPRIEFAGYFQTVEFGAGSANLTFSSSAIGSVPQLGAGSANVAFASSASGFKQINASASPNVILSSSASGFRTVFGAGSPSLALSSSASGLRTLLGASTGQISLSTAASGSRTLQGAASSSFALTSSASGFRSVFGAATPSLTFGTSADALKTLVGASNTSLAFTATSGSQLSAIGGGSARFAIVTSAQGLKTLLAQGGASVALSALATIAGTIIGAGSASVAVSGQASGLKTLLGDNDTPTKQTIALTTSASGMRIALGSAIATIHVTSATSAQLVLLGASNAQISLAANALIETGYVITFIDELTLGIEWQESRKANLQALSEFIMPIPSTDIEGR